MFLEQIRKSIGLIVATLLLGLLIQLDANRIYNFEKQQDQILLSKINDVQSSAERRSFLIPTVG
jgi:hypothetical protein